MKYFIVLLLTGCITPQQPISTSSKTERNKMLICRVMCDKNAKSFNPMTGECECYPSK